MWGERWKEARCWLHRALIITAGLIAGSTNAKSGSEASNFQGLSNEDANDLCERYLPLAIQDRRPIPRQGHRSSMISSRPVSPAWFWLLASIDPQRGCIRWVRAVLDQG